MKTIVPPAKLTSPDNQWKIDWLQENATQEEEFTYPEVCFGYWLCTKFITGFYSLVSESFLGNIRHKCTF